MPYLVQYRGILVGANILYAGIQYTFMATTIKVSKELLRELEELKKEKKSKSYEEVLRQLIRGEKALKKSHFGSLPELEEFQREEIDRFD